MIILLFAKRSLSMRYLWKKNDTFIYQLVYIKRHQLTLFAIDTCQKVPLCINLYMPKGINWYNLRLIPFDSLLCINMYQKGHHYFGIYIYIYIYMLLFCVLVHLVISNLIINATTTTNTILLRAPALFISKLNYDVTIVALLLLLLLLWLTHYINGLI